MHTTPRPSLPKRRDLRIDVLRGVALIVILWAHLGRIMMDGDAWLFALRPGAWGLSDAADMFVFLSGYVYGLAYRRVYDTGGARAVLRKSVLRAWDLYAINTLTFALALGLCAWFYLYIAPAATAAIPHLAPFFADPLVTLVRAPLLDYRVPYFDILVLYIELLLLAPLFYVALRWRLGLGLGLSLALYALAQLGVGLGRPVFNPFAWQFLFVLALAISTHGVRFPRRRAWLVAALVVGLGLLLAIRGLHPLAVRGLGPDLDWLRLMAYGPKNTLGPLRLVQFFALAYLVFYVTRLDGKVWASRALEPFRLASKHSLGVFAFGILCTYLGGLASWAFGMGDGAAVAAALAAGAASLAFAYVLEWKAKASRRPPVAAPPAVPRA